MYFYKIENDDSSNFDFHIVRAGTHVFFQAHLLKKKKKKNRSAITWCPPKKSLSLFLCVHRKTNSKHKTMKNKDKNAKTNLESHYARKRSGKKHLAFQKWHNF